MLRPTREFQGDAGERNHDDPYQNGSAYAPRHQDGDQDQSQRREKYLWIGDFPNPDERSGIGDDYFRIAHSDESDKEANTGRGPVLEAIRNVIHDVLTDVRERQ